MFPLTKTVTFDNKTGDMDLLIAYSPNADVLPGLPTQVGQYLVKNGKPLHANNKLGASKVKFQFKVCNNIHQIPVLESTELIEEWTEEVKVAVKKAVPVAPTKTEEGKESVPAPATTTEQEWETQQKRKTRTEPINFDTQSFALPPQQRAQFKSLEE